MSLSDAQKANLRSMSDGDFKDAAVDLLSAGGGIAQPNSMCFTQSASSTSADVGDSGHVWFDADPSSHGDFVLLDLGENNDFVVRMTESGVYVVSCNFTVVSASGGDYFGYAKLSLDWEDMVPYAEVQFAHDQAVAQQELSKYVLQQTAYMAEGSGWNFTFFNDPGSDEAVEIDLAYAYIQKVA